MTERTSYVHGTPSWIDHSSDDPDQAVAFYKELFGWEAENAIPDGGEGGPYYMCQVNGKNVAAVGAQQATGTPAAWNTYITVDSADSAAEKIAAAGGQVMMQPFDVFDAGRMAVAADPAGATFAVWEPRESIGAELVNEPGALVWNELVTADADALTSFYREVFGWRTTLFQSEGGPPYTLLHLAGDDEPGMDNVIGGAVSPPDTATPSMWNAYVAVEDADRAVEVARGRGGDVVMSPVDMPWGRMAVLRDPLGAVFTVLRMPDSPPDGGS